MGRFLEGYFKFIKKFLSGSSGGVSVGLDIGTGECKLVQIAKSSDGYEVLNWLIEPVKNGDILLTVRGMLDQLKVSCKSLNTSVFGKGTLIRYITMPRMQIDDLRNSFSIEADKYFPFAQNQIHTDCFILDQGSKDPQMAVMAAAAKKELVNERVKLLKDLNLQPSFIGINPIALANVINVLGLSDEEKGDEKKEGEVVTAILDMGDTISNLTIMLGKLPWFTRDIFIGGQEFTKRISNALGVSLEEAEKLKRQPQGRQEEVVNAYSSAVMNMIKELHLSFDYFSTERNKEINQLLLTGGGSLLEGIADVFTKNLDIKVRKWNPLSELKMSSEADGENIERNALKLGVALGLALYQ